jgi:hypothetical protein
MELAFTDTNGQKRGGLVSESRTGKRFPLELPIKIHKAEESGQHAGVTGNLSAAGVYIRADAALEVGSNVEFEISLPTEVTGAKEPVIVQCRGRVVRADEPVAGNPKQARGVACVIDSYDFVRRE